MNAKSVARYTVGSMLVYVVVAACSSGSMRSQAALTDGGNVGVDVTATDGQPEEVGMVDALSDTAKSIMDAVTDPVSEAAADPFLSGTRLKAKYYAGADGSKQFLTMFDSMLSVDCTFQYAVDGMIRCLPVGGGLPGGSPVSALAQFGVYALYADAGCTTLLGVAPAPSALKYVVAPDPTVQTPPGGTAYRVYPVVAPYTGTTYQKAGPGPTQCIVQASNAGAGSSFYSAGAEVPAGSFAQATVMVEP